MSKDFKIGDNLFHVFFDYSTLRYNIFPVTLLDSEYADCYDKAFAIKPHSGVSVCFDSELFETEQQAAQEITNILKKKIKCNARDIARLEEERNRLAADMEKFEKIACGESENSHASGKQQKVT